MRLTQKLKHALSLCLVLALVVCGVTVMPVSAGKAGGYVVDSSKLSTETLSLAEWKFDDAGISLQEGVLVFDELYDLENPVLSRTPVYSSEEIKQTLEVRYVLNIDEIKGNKKFGLGFGIHRLDRDIDEEGATFLYAQATENGVGFGLSTVKNGEIVQLKELTHYGSKAKDVNVTVRVMNDGELMVLLGSGVFYTGAAGEVKADGYLGFSSSGEFSGDDCYVKATVANFVAYNEYYAKPESPLRVLATFSNDEFNVNEWVMNSTMIPNGTGIIAENGHLTFMGAGQNSAIAAQFKYSNFELQYEIFGMKNTLTSYNGMPVAPSWWVQMAWGTDGDSAYGVAANYNAAYRLIFEVPLDTDPESPTYLQRPPEGGMAVHFYDPTGWKGAYAIPEKYNFSRPDFDSEKRVQIRLENVDGVVVLYMKLLDETEWTQIWSYAYENGIMPLGYIALRTEGNQYADTASQYYRGGWFSIDNIMVKNYDKNPTLTTVTFESNRIPPMPDYDYKDPYDDSYLIDNTGGKLL